MKKILYFLIPLVIVAFIAGLFITAYKAIHKPAEPAPIHSGMHPVLAVDYSNDKIINQDELLKGEDAILIVKNKANTQMFNSVAALLKLDANQDQRLDKKDPLFTQIQLMFFTEAGKNKKFKTLTEAGITAIVFDKAGLAQLNNNVNAANVVIGRALTEKGKSLLIKIVPVGIPNS